MKRVMSIVLLVAVGLGVGVGYTLIFPADVKAGPMGRCDCQCINSPWYMQPTPLCNGGMGWFADACASDPFGGGCVIRPCSGEQQYFGGCVDQQ
jgi:hypothetical protein